jgi:ATP-dependent DNA helicase RecG
MPRPSKTQKTPEIDPLNRIVIGDVGSGKTIVAFTLGCVFLHSQLQKNQPSSIVLIAPTEVLAYQHYKNLEQLRNDQSDRLSFIHTLYLSGKKYEYNGEKITEKQLQKLITELPYHLFIVGTHAVLHREWLQADMVLVDEQHRFGVLQRQKLIRDYQETHRGGLQPHYVSFSATPIPRTLALTLYSDLKPHFLEPLAAKKPITTRLQPFDKLLELKSLIQGRLDNCEKVFVICPQIEESEDAESQDYPLWSVYKAAKTIREWFPEKVSMIHGKLKDKQKKLTDFAESDEKPILVSTTVIEVGVDVPQATLMIILNAERFGLSSLHQIRGRIGRNSFDHNECMLVTYPHFLGSQKLRYLTELQNGFILAEKDLELRGSGDLIGAQQSGFADDIQELMNMSREDQQALFGLVHDIPYDDLADKLPRLQAYLETESQNIWEE